MERVVLLTGATDGIGRASARELADGGFHVLVHGRRPRKVDEVVEELRGGGHDADGFVADFARLDDVRRLAREVASGGRLHVLLANAGVFVPEPVVTTDGHELTFQVNYLAHALLALLLLPTLRRSAPARILLTSSVAHRSADLDLDDLDSERAYAPYEAYARSKLCLILFARALARRLDGTGVTVNAFHPGVIETKLLAAGFGPGKGDPPEAAARLVRRLATDPRLDSVSGRYFEHGRETAPAPAALDDDLAEALWARTLELLGVHPRGLEPAAPSAP